MTDSLSGKRVLVTGGTGSIGEALIRQLLAHDIDRVISVSRDETQQFRLKSAMRDDRMEVVPCDITDQRALSRVFEQRGPLDVVYHAAAMKHLVMCEMNPAEASYVNIGGTQNVVDLGIRFGVDRVIFVSTDKSVDPISVLGATKLVAERVFLQAAILRQHPCFAIVRFGNVANSRGSVIPTMIESLLRYRSLVVTDETVTRFLMRTEDAVRLILDATDLAIGGEIFVLKMDAFVLRDLVEAIVDCTCPRFVKREEIEIKRIGLQPGEKLHESLLSSSERDRVSDLGKMLVVLQDRHREYDPYKNLEQASPSWCTSDKANRLAQQRLRDYVKEHLSTLPLRTEE